MRNPEDKNSVLRVLSEAVSGKAAGAMRTGGRIFHAQPEDDCIRVRTSDGEILWKKETIKKALEEHTR